MLVDFPFQLWVAEVRVYAWNSRKVDENLRKPTFVQKLWKFRMSN